jgi:hypothetical protein
MTVDVIDYLGKFEDGILVLLSLGHEHTWYEATFYYQKQMLALTPDSELEEKIGCYIEDWPGYEKLMFDILEKVVPYDEMINRIDDFNPSDYSLYLDSGTQSFTE